MPAGVLKAWRQVPVREVTTESGQKGWLVTGMAEVRTVLSDPRFSRAEARRIGAVVVPSAVLAKPGINDLDGPGHARMRRLVAGAFSARRIRALRPRIQQITDELIAPLVAADPPADLVAGLCRPLPLTVIFEILGVPQEDRARFSGWADRVMATTAYPPGESLKALEAVISYMSDLVATKRRAPDDSLLQELITARDEEDRLSEEELVHLGCGLLMAGNESTATELGKGLAALLDNHDQLEALRADPTLVPAAVEEVLRYAPLSARENAGQVRATTCDVELGGVVIPGQSVVFASLPGANFDPHAFVGPERFDITRENADGHVTFGYGAHRCLGAQLARMELEVAFKSVLAAFPGLRLAVPAEGLANAQGRLISGMQALPVTW
ncbi:cytochrome P450 [Streptomyces sp. ISL-100]|uniref:cytochrome P450 n=1 Tax=Streptomyces sp. ISL-100 TaxID=2819173 RepID=UPI001BE68C73|nr:cytochrome P450 [Streptomyces sp. ISL-100]MBT2399856.1 cytochrome P450 [Streptomyces sp. ISL-100]